jgi:hypothetical protein
MKTLCIPEIGTRLVLADDWVFNLYNESRNESLVEAVRFPDDCGKIPWYANANVDSAAKAGWSVSDEANSYDRLFYKQITLPKGTALKIDRIYIRKGSSGFSSVSFFIERKSVDPNFSEICKRIYNGKGKCRFWTKLKNVNTISYL